MRVGCSKLTISSRIIAVLLLTLLLTSCISSNHFLTPVSSINWNNNIDNQFSCVLIVPAFKINTLQEHHSMITSSTQVLSTQLKQNKLATPIVLTQNGRTVQKRKHIIALKGNYTGCSVYTVKYGDTLFYIGWITGNNLQHLAQTNNIKHPYSLKVGQTPQITNVINKPLISAASSYTVLADKATSKNNSSIPEQNTTIIAASKPIVSYTKKLHKRGVNNISLHSKDTGFSFKKNATIPIIRSIKPTDNNALTNLSNYAWYWPTKGKIIESFSSSDGGNKGIDIAGNKGQSIVTAADGHVVYAGNALRGYGNLIIIKHNHDYLSAYAHNDIILVRAKQKVKAGQKIATMGSTGTNSIRLHFEIHYKGKSVNPLRYLLPK